MKKCRKCGIQQELSDFQKRNDSPDGHRNECKLCRLKYQRKYHSDIKHRPKDIIPEGYKKCYECKKTLDIKMFGRDKRSKDGHKSQCKACKRAESAVWRAQNQDYAKKYREGHKDRSLEYSKNYNKENKDKIKETKKIYVEKNRDAVAQQKKEWYEANKEKAISAKRRRRALKYSVDENYSIIDRLITMREFQYRCFKCKSQTNLHIDHHRPLSQQNALTLDNAVVLCKRCNSSKGTRHPEEFYGKKVAKALDAKLSNILDKHKGDKK